MSYGPRNECYLTLCSMNLMPISAFIFGCESDQKTISYV